MSALLLAGHTATAALLGNSLAWIAAVVLLVIAVRAALYPVVRGQAVRSVTMDRLRPAVEKIRRTHTDPRRQSAELRKLYAEHDVRLFGGFLPMLGQALLFLGLFHVLRSFDRTAAAALPFGSTAHPLSPEVNAATANYLLDPGHVRAFLEADLFGAPLSAALAGAATPLTIALVAVPLALLAAVAAHATARMALRRGTDRPSLPMVRPLTLWVLPGTALAGAALLPVVVLVYLATNAACTLALQLLAYRGLPSIGG
ncbi:membrane protein insertase YidC [Nocardia asteroides]|uniref:membrane protein insertase YidC n=1 Tax=Nocardia asteroides TaxID=1824 RepID=UPI001E2F0BC2|nr:membrane protein insertase YidC [Nocardia asteroides]UGT62953.1 membrane protein insertase YidC [Nocardia asteroides]